LSELASVAFLVLYSSRQNEKALGLKLHKRPSGGTPHLSEHGEALQQSRIRKKMATQLTFAFNPMLAAPESVNICHARVHATTMREAVEIITNYAAKPRGPAYVVTPNAQHLVIHDRDEHFREIYSHADLVLPDGSSLLLAARLMGRRLKERVAGVDLFKALCGRAAELGLSVYLLGGQPGSADLAARKLKAAYPNLIVAGTCCPAWGFEKDVQQLAAIAGMIRAAQPHILFVGLGAPKQENWIYEHGLKLGVPVSMGIGGSFEMVGGITSRAPLWMQEFGLEWLFRLAMEPGRLGKRYLIGNLQFMAMVAKQILHPNLYPANEWPAGSASDL
jgi:N-acetylglucosaminyldiphosphoundecaprenol N-acetyl-beta-D-mannosaminyltransferase